jgi:hypothetical protein
VETLCKFRFAEYVDPISERYDALVVSGQECRFGNGEIGGVQSEVIVKSVENVV